MKTLTIRDRLFACIAPHVHARPLGFPRYSHVRLAGGAVCLALIAGLASAHSVSPSALAAPADRNDVADREAALCHYPSVTFSSRTNAAIGARVTIPLEQSPTSPSRLALGSADVRADEELWGYARKRRRRGFLHRLCWLPLRMHGPSKTGRAGALSRLAVQRWH
jgi:hypothetical protein